MKKVGRTEKGVSIWYNGFDYDVVLENTNPLTDEKDGTFKRVAICKTLPDAISFREKFIKDGYVYA